VTPLIEKARQATTTLRDFARVHGMHHKERDPLVMAIHDALDSVEALTAAHESLKGEHERLRAQSNSNATAAVLLFEDRAAIERQAITETLDKVLMISDQWGDCFWSNEEVNVSRTDGSTNSHSSHSTLTNG
jgi:hypothetical protein